MHDYLFYHQEGVLVLNPSHSTVTLHRQCNAHGDVGGIPLVPCFPATPQYTVSYREPLCSSMRNRLVVQILMVVTGSK